MASIGSWRFVLIYRYPQFWWEVSEVGPCSGRISSGDDRCSIESFGSTSPLWGWDLVLPRNPSPKAHWGLRPFLTLNDPAWIGKSFAKADRLVRIIIIANHSPNGSTGVLTIGRRVSELVLLRWAGFRNLRKYYMRILWWFWIYVVVAFPGDVLSIWVIERRSQGYQEGHYRAVIFQLRQYDTWLVVRIDDSGSSKMYHFVICSNRV